MSDEPDLYFLENLDWTDDDDRSPARLQADAERRSRHQTVEAMIERYAKYGQPIDEEGYIGNAD